MELVVTHLVEAMFLPPGGLLLIWLVGLLLLWRRAGLGVSLLWLGCAAGYVMSTPLGADALLRPLEDRHPPLTSEMVREANAGAIVVLAGGLYRVAPEFDGDDTVGDETLVRLRYAAYLHRVTHLPVVVSGGIIASDSRSLAVAMAAVLRDEFGVADVWLEAQSRTTAENAVFTKEMLASKQVDRVFLVTHAAHMPRSVAVFRHVGLDVIPAPTRFFSRDPNHKLWRSMVPGAGSLELARAALHEWIGQAWYALRHGVN